MVMSPTKPSQRRSPVRRPSASRALPKAPTGIQGLDEVTGGGLPRGRPTLVCGSAGCGKTLFAMEFLVYGAMQCNEPGVFMAFEETGAELAQNVRSLGFDLDQLVKQKRWCWISCASNAARSTKPATMTWKGSSYG
jgi:circadian clock protein KaiC